MTTPNFMTAFDQIVDTRLPSSTMRLALKLLRLVDQTGSLCLDWEEILNLTGGVTNRGSVRRHLISLKQAGIITYATNGHVLLAFCAYEGCALDIGQASETISARGFPCADAREWEHESVEHRVPARRNQRADARKMENRRAGFRAQSPLTPPSVCLSVDQSLHEQTNKHVVSFHKEAPTLEEQERSFRLLTDPEVGIEQQQARQLAGKHHFGWIEKHVFAYQADRERGKAQGTGALIHRLVSKWSTGALTNADRDSALYARHHDVRKEQAEQYSYLEEYWGNNAVDVAQSEERYDGQEELGELDKPMCALDRLYAEHGTTAELKELWQLILAQCATWDIANMLAGSGLLAIDSSGERAVVAVKASKREYIEVRQKKPLLRELKLWQHQYPVVASVRDLIFVALDGPAHDAQGSVYSESPVAVYQGRTPTAISAYQ